MNRTVINRRKDISERVVCASGIDVWMDRQSTTDRMIFKFKSQ